jgi:hypothetical protein
MLAFISALVSWLAGRFRSCAELELEVIALRHQLAVLRRQRPGRTRLSALDRLLWIWLYRVWPRCLNIVVLVKMTTVVHWHRQGFRVKLLSRQSPASIVFFDLLCEGNRDWRSEPFEQRREKLESLLASAMPPIHLTPATRELNVASDWFRRFEGAGLDGVMAKPISGTYQPDKRVMFKVKHERDCDCVVAGFLWHKGGEGTAIGSLLLGLFDGSGRCNTSACMCVCARFATAHGPRERLLRRYSPESSESYPLAILRGPSARPWGSP